MKSLLCALLLTAGISHTLAADSFYTELSKNLPKGFGAAVAKEAKTIDEFASATAVMALFALGESIYQGKRNAFTEKFLKDYLQYAAITKIGIVLYAALVKDREKTAKAIAEFYKRYARRYYDSFPKESKNKTVPVPQLAS